MTSSLAPFAQSLSELFAKKPIEEKYITKAVDYGVFSNINTNLLLLGTAHGYGVVKDNKTGKDIYMKMGQLGVGPGLGIKNFKAVILFKDSESPRPKGRGIFSAA